MDNNSREDLLVENEMLKSKLLEATDTLDAIRTGQVDALVVTGNNGHSLYTLQSADQAYRVFIEQMAEGAVTLNLDGLIIYCNSQFARIINTPLSRIVGRTFSEFVTNDDGADFDNLFAQSWNKNVTGEIAIRSGSDPVYVKLSMNALDLVGENAVSVIVTDLTYQKKIEKQLKNQNEELIRLNDALISSNQDLQQFASVASHDLQEPLRKIQVFVKFLKDRSYSELSDSSKQYVEKIIAAAHRMKILIIDILTYSKLSAGETGIEPVDLKAIFNEILEDFDLRINERNAKIELADLCFVEGNKGQLRQVFHNLVSNALKFVSGSREPALSIQKREFSAKELGLSLENEADYCRIIVSDNGIGFDETYSSSIFNLFEKLNPKTTYEGSGIGLAIAKKIIEKHHGIIIARSRPGEGSEFNVILPFKQPGSR
jgi:PAS domain S-box-containing protein